MCNGANVASGSGSKGLRLCLLQGRIMLDLISEPDIFGIQWEAKSRRYGFLYPAYPDLLGPTAQVILCAHRTQVPVTARRSSSTLFLQEPGLAGPPWRGCGMWAQLRLLWSLPYLGSRSSLEAATVTAAVMFQAVNCSKRNANKPMLTAHTLMCHCLQAILRIDSSAIFMVEGTGQANRFPGMAWGNGFVTNASLIQRYNLSDPTAFFDNLLEVPELLNRTILAPHVYGPNVTVGNAYQATLLKSQDGVVRHLQLRGWPLAPSRLL